MSGGSVRIDRWLCAARFYKSRTQAQDACLGSHVKVDGKNVRPSHPVKVGDRIEARAPRGKIVVVVRELEEKRQAPPRARELYDDHSPPPEKPEDKVGQRERGMGRPTKADRRNMEKFRGEY